jgi:hypothetical protein
MQIFYVICFFRAFFRAIPSGFATPVSGKKERGEGNGNILKNFFNQMCIIKNK